MSGPYRDEPARADEGRVLVRSSLPDPPTRNLRALDFSDGSLVVQWLQPARILGARTSVLGIAAGLGMMIPAGLFLPHVAGTLLLFTCILAGGLYGTWRPDVAEEIEVTPNALAWRANRRRGRRGALLLSEVVDVRFARLHALHAVRIESTSARFDLFTPMASNDEPLLDIEATWVVERVQYALARARG